MRAFSPPYGENNQGNRAASDKLCEMAATLKNQQE
jgi:hypothetical protein